MNRSTELLRAYTALIRRVSGAESVCLFVPSSGDAKPLLVHDGELLVPELATLEAAEAFADRTDAIRLEHVESTATNGRLVSVPCAPSPKGDTPDAPASTLRRRARDADELSGEAIICWVGLRFDEAHSGRAQAEDALRLLLTRSVNGSAQDDQASLLRLGGVLAWYARQISSVLDDPVTGLAGRAEFQASLHHAMEQSQATETPLSLLFINPDDFTSVNENQGHEAGDRVLREIGARLRTTHRTSDAIAKYGGAIFASFLPDTDLTAARIVAEKVWSSLAKAPYLDGSVRLGISVGLAVFEPGDPTIDGHLELIRRADKALNAAKRFGGDHVAAWEPELEAQDIGNVDRMTGVYTGHMAKDYRNMTLLSDTMSAVAGAADVSELITRVVERLYGTLKPDCVAIYEELHGELRLMKGLSKSSEQADGDVVMTKEQRALVEDARRQKNALLVTYPDGTSGKKVLAFAVPLLLNERSVGCLYLDGSEVTLALEGSADLGFLRAFATQLAVALDRARLAELSKRRSENEQLRLRAEVEDLRASLQKSKLLYRSAEMESVIQTIQRVAPTKATVLVIGESGTGKELVARTIHELSPFKHKPLVVVDCGAIPTTLIESELFGHERGAYTGAQEKRIGRLLEAEGGTVVLDEIGELPLEVQSKLLRFVQERQVMPVGGTRIRRVDTRLVAVTNRELAVEAAAGRFREDLYYRLNVVRITVPPLRERPDDILHLAQHFLEHFSKQYQKAELSFSPAAKALMTEYNWPGNVRELQHRIMQAVILCEESELGATELELESLPPDQTVEMDLSSLRRPPASRAPSVPVQAPQNGHASPKAAWEAIRTALRRQIDAAVSEIGAQPVPIGTWLEEDIVLESFEAAGQVSGRARSLLGVPETTFRRRLRKAMSKSKAGLLTRTSPWEEMAPLIADLVRTPALGSGGDVVQRARSILLHEVLASAVSVGAGAALMGVTIRTYRRWTADAISDASTIADRLHSV